MHDTSIILNLHFLKRVPYYHFMDVKPSLCSGRQKWSCGYPPSIARSQNIETGILGLQKKKRAFIEALFYDLNGGRGALDLGRGAS